ncbi:hypothetical protein, partial [Algoriphagus ratkowskyi]|uniref:hypothetical protein n=1 Tax=Algoriphagus ratkowskyi TaxID=57028 RepID=UPI00196AEBAE
KFNQSLATAQRRNVIDKTIYLKEFCVLCVTSATSAVKKYSMINFQNQLTRKKIKYLLRSLRGL